MNRHWRTSLGTLIVGVALLLPATVSAQLDPLLFLKNTQPNVILVVETANRMQRDADSVYYDPGTYTETGNAYEAVLGLLPTEAQSSYRRKYSNLQHENPASASDPRFSADRIEVVGDLESGYGTFYERTKLAIARRGLVQAINDNLTNARFALIKTRQTTPAWPSSAGNSGPVRVADATQAAPTDTGSNGRWNISRTSVANGTTNSTTTTSGLLTSASAANANTTILATLGRGVGEANALIPAGADSRSVTDAPVGFLLDDARAHASTLISADIAAAGCRNTIVVMVVAGDDPDSSVNLRTKANTFLSVSGRRVPIYVIALAPDSSDVSNLREIATESGGQYFEITAAMVNATTAGQPVPEVVRAVNLAIQHAFTAPTDFNTAPSSALPFGPSTEHQVTSPIIGTVNLRRATRLNPTTGNPELLPDAETQIYHVATGVEIPQRSNVLVTSGFALPGFEGRLRAARVYRPVTDSSRPSGYRFSQDGSRLWVASTPAASSRNIFTILPGQTTLTRFHTDNVSTLDDFLNVSDPATLIDWIRSQPLGAVVGSTPAFLDPPSLDPPPDDDYPNFREENKDRRSLIVFGANDGMLHVLDARTGKEVWAFIPFNLLPKLRALRFGQSLDAFKFFVDSSPKISDVKVGGNWRTFVFFGQGPGGTFYNALDVTLDDLSDTIAEDSTDDSAILSYFSNAERITWEWSFPRNTSFDWSIVSPTSPYGDISSAATATEKSVGQTWSDPAIGQLTNESGPFVMLVGSGFLKRSVEQQANRAGASAGRSFYVLDVASGVVHDTKDVGADSQAESGTAADDCRAANDCRNIKNALQMDPVATGPADSRFISKVYIGDLDGKVYRFNLSVSGTSLGVLSTPTSLYNAGANFPMFSSMAAVNVGTQQYLFVGTGSELLPSNGVNYSYSLLVLLDTGATATRTAEIALERTDGSAGDEKVTSFPAVAGDIVFFSTTTHNPTTPCTPFTANLYAFTFIGGPAYDTNNDGRLSTSTGGGGSGRGGSSGGGSTGTDSTKVFSTAGARATAPFIVDQHLVFAAGGTIQMFGDPDDFNNGVGQAGVRLLSWRMVR